MRTIKVMTILGTRPEIIRLSRVMALLDTLTNHVTVHTGQNYDYELNDVFYKDLRVRKPDYFLGVKSGSLGEMIARIIEGVEKVLVREKPDAVLILGDTNSAMAGIIAKRLKIPIFHMEAGNRCFDLNVPEEINRRIIDHISDMNLVYTEHARRNLLREGLHPRTIYITGSPMREVLDHCMPQIEQSSILKKLSLKENAYFVLSMHREENVDNADNLMKIVTAANRLAETYRLPVIVSTHPRTRKRLNALRGWKRNKRIQFLKPFGFFDYIRLQKNARCVISDSGTISEESSMLDFPAITIRNAIERPEAMDTGAIILAGLETDTILSSVAVVAGERKAGRSVSIPADYCIANTSERVVKLIIGTAGLIHRWNGIIRAPGR